MGNFRKIIACFLFSGIVSVQAFAQTQDPATTYNNGKVLLQQQKYDLAMAELQPITAGTSAYAPEASYFYALAALKSKKLQQSYDMLLQLQNQHPNWNGMNDADYLLANVLFEQGDYQRALSKLQELQGTPLASDAEGLKRYYLSKLNDRAAFEQLLQRYSNDKVVAQVYADKLIGGWYRPQDKQTLENIVSRHNLDRSRYLSKDVLRNQGFDVALLLPFQLNQDYQQTARTNKFVTDLYAGMKLAQDSLQKQGININLYNYDTSADTMSVKRVLDLQELQQMDLVIGPIYKSTAKMAARFAAQNNINVINPLSQDLEMVRGNTNAFLFESSVATQARQAATYAYQNFSPKTAAILFESAKEDTTFAYYYRQQFIKLGGKVRTYRKVNSTQTTATAALFNGLNLQDLGHIAVFSDKMTAAVNATSVVQSKAPKLPIVTYDKWLDIGQITLRQLDNLEVYFISPKYLNKQTPANDWFRKKYVNRYNMSPTVYAYAGFEMMYYFGQLLQSYGPQFNQQLQSTSIKPGVFYSGLGYTDPGARNEVRQDNQYVPITKLENLELTVVNPVF
ncbi:ABC transporter substrate-binding protein [Pontibacter cellulosilyticus]|uniref:ABC transporter substrate-binding protein n=1 Tax=Pontibacter cellulosilyticus TaxID=1720253 RepID=A0A923N3E2_9BACT|nr:ABC transporter substrate-binding protein [Pontibacter cellulosilyticus]MBC5992160.1 ABC transporter substrate-binding protein [Pontibacter cellulosilyticus]